MPIIETTRNGVPGIEFREQRAPTPPFNLTAQYAKEFAELEAIALLPSGAARRTAVLERVRRAFPGTSAALAADFAMADAETVGEIIALNRMAPARKVG